MSIGSPDNPSGGDLDSLLAAAELEIVDQGSKLFGTTTTINISQPSHSVVLLEYEIPAYQPELVDCNEVWQYEYGLSTDVNRNCRVDLPDFALLALDWLKCNDPNEANCGP